MKSYRQGDVLLVRVDRAPKGAKAVRAKGGRVVLAHGEVTGHAHEVDAAFAKELVREAERFINVKPGAQVTHQEHATIALPAGTYRVVRQREYSPEAIRNVAD